MPSVPYVADSQGYPIYQYLAMLAGTLSAISSGMHYGWPSPSLPQLLNKNSTHPITAEEGSWIAVMPLLGGLTGCFVIGLISIALGRKQIILLACFPYFIAWITIAYTQSVPALISARFIAGIADGLLFCALPMYLGEIADPKVRGTLGSSVIVTWTFGIFLINVIGSYLGIRTTAIISSAIPVLCLITFVWMPESPYFLIMKGNIPRARKNLQIFKRSNTVERELERIEQTMKEQNKNVGRFLDLFVVKSYRKALLIMLGILTAQQMSGTTAFMFYAHTIFEEAGDSNIISSGNSAIIYFTVQLASCGCCSMIVDKTGRKPLMILSTVGAGVALFTEGCYFYALNVLGLDLTHFTWIPLATMVFFVVLFSIGMHTIPLLLLGEFFPTHVKAFALSLIDICFSAFATIASKFFQISKDNFGLHVPFYVFFVCSVLGLLFIIYCVPETKGKTLEDIQDELRGRTEKNEEGEELTEIIKILPNA